MSSAGENKEQYTCAIVIQNQINNKQNLFKIKVIACTHWKVNIYEKY